MIKSIRNGEINRETPVIVVTESLNPEKIKQLAKYRVSKIFPKTIKPLELQEAVSQILNFQESS